MTFRTKLAEGTLGVRLTFPESLEVVHDEAALVLIDRDLGLQWIARLYPWPLELSEANEALLRRDVERTTRALFEKSFTPQEESEGAPGACEPRTADPSWSPVVDFERGPWGGADCLRVIHRLAYQPGREFLAGRLQAPLATGVFELSMEAAAGTTGLRECAIMVLKGDDGSLTQSDFDDPAWDREFADHPLSRVRNALAWVLEESDFTVTAAAAPPVAGLVVVEEASCAIVPGSRFQRVAPGIFSMSPTLASFARTACPAAEPCLLDVWHWRKDKIQPGDHAEVVRVAEVEAKAWAQQGIANLRIAPQGWEETDGRAVYTSLLRFEVEGDSCHSVQAWFQDNDGALFRVCRSSSDTIPQGELEEEVWAAVASWRRMATDPAA